MKNYILGSDILGAEPSDEVGASVEQFNKGMADYWKKNPNATDSDVARFKASWGPLDSGRAAGPVYAASAYTAARGCHANGMTIWHYIFFAVFFAAIFFAPRIFVYAKRKFFSSPTKTDLVDATPSTTEGRTS